MTRAGVRNLVTFELHSDLTLLVMEVAGASARSNTESEPATLKTILEEMEEAGLVDVTVNGHNLQRQTEGSDLT